MISINWSLIVDIVSPLAGAAVGAWLMMIFSRKPRLILFLQHAGSHVVRPRGSDESNIDVFTHSIVIRNDGNSAASNVKIGHHILPINTKISPDLPCTIEHGSDGGSEIVIASLAPKQQFTLSYLYYPPLTWDKINSYTKCDEGMAEIITVLPSPQPKKWIIWALGFLVLVGFFTVIYLLYYWLKNKF
jgi:hypothetical protein